MSETMMSGGDSMPADEWKDFDFSTVKVEKSRATRILPKHEILRFAIAGLAGGALVWLIRLALDNWVMWPLFCRTPDTASICLGAGSTSFVISLIIVGLIAASILSAQRVFRAALITAATFVGLGALWPILDARGDVVATILTALFAVALFLFLALIGAVKKYVLSVVLLAVLAVAFWLIVRL